MNTSPLRKITWACALCSSIFSGLSARAAEWFARAGVHYVGYTASGFSSETGGSLAAGAAWGAAQEHELSLEAMRADWSWHEPMGLAVLPGLNGSGHTMPLLANYRHYFAPAAARFRVYVGVSAGLAKTEGEVTVGLSGIQYRGNPDETGFVAGATLGVAGKLSGSLSYDLGYRYLHAEGFDAPSTLFLGTAGYTGGPGPVIHFPALGAHCVTLSLRISF